MSVSIIAWLAYDTNEGGENTTQNLSSCQKVIPRRNITIETANKVINKQGKGVMLVHSWTFRFKFWQNWSFRRRNSSTGTEKNQSLIYLQLSHHKISDAGAEKFVAVLQCNETLMFLGFMHNWLTKPGNDLFEGLGGHLAQTGYICSCGYGVEWIRS